MRLGFLPKKVDFFTDFVRLADRLRDGSALLETMLAGETPDAAKAGEIQDAEAACDTITHDIIQRLNRTFITPIDREDIHALARTLDDVMDAIDAAATLLPLYEIPNVRFGARELAAVISSQTATLYTAIGALRQRQTVYELIREIHTLEHHADGIYHDSVKRLFREEGDPIAVIKWKEIFDQLEAATDAAEAAADVIEGIVLKHS